MTRSATVKTYGSQDHQKEPLSFPSKEGPSKDLKPAEARSTLASKDSPLNLLLTDRDNATTAECWDTMHRPANQKRKQRAFSAAIIPTRFFLLQTSGEAAQSPTCYVSANNPRHADKANGHAATWKDSCPSATTWERITNERTDCAL